AAKARTPEAAAKTRAPRAAPDTARDRAVEHVVSEIRRGKMVVVVDDEHRENEGDLIMAAEKATPDAVNFMVTHGRGLLCVPLDEDQAARLELFPMSPQNTALHGTSFTVSVDAIRGTTTGISAADRAATVKRLADPRAVTSDFARPGH